MNKIILSMGLFFIATNISAQHAIGTLSPEPSSAFDITSTTGGFLLPRMSNAERKLISNAAEGLQVYVTDYNNGSLMIFDGSNWNVFSKTIVVDDTTAPVITSPETGINLQENIEAGQTIYTITAIDATGVGSYAIAGTDAALLSVNAGSGVVILTADPDYETKNSYSFAVTATDAAGNTSAATTVTFAITNVDEVVPTITSGTTGTNKAENSGAGQTIYTIAATANDGGTIASYTIAGTDVDAGLLSVNAGGVVTLTADPDYETKPSYSFTVTASDAAGTSAATTVTFAITNVDEVVPTITSGATGTNKAENSGAGQTIYIITADANDGGTIASYAISGTDAALLSVNAGGVVTLTADPDYETKNSYSFTVTATDAAGTSNATTVTFSITDVNEIVVEVGDSYEGGIVFYLAPSPTDLDGDGVNDTGLIYAYSNYTTTKPWNAGGWCGGCASISTSTAIGTGATNTTNIINEYSNSGTASAAGFARAYNGGGFNDWFLPSTLEQDALVSYFIEKYPASGGWSDWGGIRSNNYWSSSQHNGNKAKQRSFTTGTSPVNNNKGNAVRVIPIRAF
ncbi:MAG: cadherin repeat domain-containing protein [Flavobacterium sp.]|nr:cadherin repeat domain-containing protein [Flavobacterium sp.]